MQLLLKSKPQTAINWQDYEGRMPIHLAVIHTNLGTIAQERGGGGALDRHQLAGLLEQDAYPIIHLAVIHTNL